MRSSAPWYMAGRLWPRHSHRGRPLNAIVSSMVVNQRPLKPWLELGLVGLSVAYAAMAGYAVSRGREVPERTEMLWALVFSVLVTWWSREDRTATGARVKWEFS